jgi:hypothetical protein
LHLLQIFLTDALTFISGLLSFPINDSASGEVVRGELDFDLVARKNLDVMHPHFARDMRQHFVAVVQLNTEHSVRERFQNRAGYLDRILFRHT